MKLDWLKSQVNMGKEMSLVERVGWVEEERLVGFAAFTVEDKGVGRLN